MEKERDRKRGRLAVLVIPLLAAFASASRVGDNVRTVDFLRIFAAGMLIGVVLTKLFQLMSDKKKDAA